MTGWRLGQALTALLILAGAALPVEAQTIFRPVAVVNDDAVTGFDLAQRAQIFTTLGAAAPTPDALRRQALNSLIEEKLKLQSGEQIGIAPTAEIVEIGLDEFAQQFGLAGEGLRQRLRDEGVTDQSIDDFVGAETIWREVVRARFLRRAEPSEAQIDGELDLIGQGQSRSFRLRELGLVLPGDDAGDEAVRAEISRIYDQLSNGGDFAAAVAELSSVPSASRQGDLGWVSASSLPPEVTRDLTRLQPGGITRPVVVEGGVSILQLLEQRDDGNQAGGGSAAEREQIRQRLISATITRLAEGFLQELRRDALIEIR
ncbi:MAG: peptidylprolyl isomerase [Pseudomonadota bacterium]